MRTTPKNRATLRLVLESMGWTSVDCVGYSGGEVFDIFRKEHGSKTVRARTLRDEETLTGFGVFFGVDDDKGARSDGSATLEVRWDAGPGCAASALNRFVKSMVALREL